MYLDYWQLATKPFEPYEGDPAFHFACERHDGALHKLRYSIQSGRDAAALAGPSGIGKTLLVRRLAEQLDHERHPVHRIVFPQMAPQELLSLIAEKLTGDLASADAPPTDRGSVEGSLRKFETIAEHNTVKHRRPVVVIDEAHLLEDAGLLETVRLLMNLGASGEPLMTLLLVGQPGLFSSIARHPGLDERVSVKALLDAFTAEETHAYVATRLAAAGASRELFSPEAITRLHNLAGGAARGINRLCDLALVVGYAAGATVVDERTIDSVHEELVSVGASRAA